MLRLRRKRSSVDVSAPPRPVDSTPPRDAGPAGIVDTPLYAKFATAHRSESSPAKPVVSGPMSLHARPNVARTPQSASDRAHDTREHRRSARRHEADLTPHTGAPEQAGKEKGPRAGPSERELLFPSQASRTEEPVVISSPTRVRTRTLSRTSAVDVPSPAKQPVELGTDVSSPSKARTRTSLRPTVSQDVSLSSGSSDTPAAPVEVFPTPPPSNSSHSHIKSPHIVPKRIHDFSTTNAPLAPVRTSTLPTGPPITSHDRSLSAGPPRKKYSLLAAFGPDPLSSGTGAPPAELPAAAANASFATDFPNNATASGSPGAQHASASHGHANTLHSSPARVSASIDLPVVSATATSPHTSASLAGSPRKSVKNLENSSAHEARPDPPPTPSKSPRWTLSNLGPSPPSAPSTEPSSLTSPMLHSSRRPPKTDADRHSWYKPAPASPKVPPKPVLEQAPTSRAASSARHQADAARHHHVSDSSRYPQAQKPTRPVQQLQQLQQAHHQLSSQPHHQLQQQHGSQRTSYQQTPQRPDRQPHQQHRKAQSLGSQQPGPVQGRPLIFAAMATTEPDPPVAEAEHGQIDMDELDVTAPGLRAMINVDAGNDKLQPVQTELNSAFVDGYPTPKSPSPPLPPEKNEQPTYPLTTKQLQMHAQMQPWPAEAPSVEQVRMQQQQPAVEVQVPRERKLSRTKGHVERVREAESAHSDAVVKPPLTAQMEAPANATSAYRSRPLPPSPVGGDEEASPPPPPPHSYSLPQQPPHMARANISPPQLGSPIQLQNQPPRPPPHARPRRQSRDGVKPLTGRQLEKLANRQILGTPGLQRNGAEEPARVVRGPLPTPPSAPVSPPTAPAPAEQRSSTRVRTTSRHRRESQHVPQPVQPVQPVKPPTPVSADEGPPRARRMSRSSSDRPRRAEDVDDTPRIIQAVPPVQPPTPISPEEYVCARSQRRSARPEKTARPVAMEPESLGSESEEVQVEKEPTWYPLARHMTDPELLAGLLPYLSFYDWSSVSAVSKEIRRKLSGDRVLCEMVLERYLRTVGYARWAWPEPDPLTLSLEDLNAYMRGVSMPTHQYARLATFYIQSRDKSQYEFMQELAASCRAYTRIVLRLRAQAEADAAANPDSRPTDAANGATSPQRGGRSPSVQSGPRGYISRSTSRGPSPTPTSYAYGAGAVSRPMSGSHNFRSPLFRLRRAPLLQVFVPSPEGEWLSDKSVEECEKELYRAGVLHLMRAGDVVWDTAVGDEGNVGRMVWDGSYLLDLDYTYSRTGDLPQYLPTLAFPPSYFHRVIRTMGNGNPICHIDISPWADEIHHNLQLLQDRVKTDTPQGGQHTVVRWVNRSSFTIRPPPGSTSIKISVPNSAGPGPSPNGSWLVDPGWYGTVVVEAEGTNEGLADLQVRCRGAFPPRAVGASANPSRDVGREERKTVFRILREKSRPGEIWIRTVRDKERLL